MTNQKYDHKSIEKNLYSEWKKNKLFSPKISVRNQKNFSIILPPPNVTGKLHLGHAWDGALQDCIIRYKKMSGYNVAWIPGTDHAGISTQTKFESILKSKNIDPKSIPPLEFKKQLSSWAREQSSYIHEQWAAMGFALAYEGETFTLDKNVNSLVNETFIKLFNKKLIYQDYRLVNWDVKLKTAISDIEVIRKTTKSKMYFFKYFLTDGKNFLPVATTRPETMFGDTNLFVNPIDKRFKKYIGQYAINPVNGQTLKILADEYIDKNFGTGVMKCTPAHDFNDFSLAQKYNIKNYISIMNPDGTLTSAAKIDNISFSGVDRIDARNEIVKILKNKNLLIKIEDHSNEVGYSERTNEIVEPLLSKQWFVKMKGIADDIIRLQKTSKSTKFFPKRMNNNLLRWLENINDWCISRQLIWGHRIPVWYDPKTGKPKASTIQPGKNWKQDESVLDTWFSSGLWPIAVTLCNKNKAFKQFYPIDVLVTAYDILFFWVARMMFQCYQIKKQTPIKNVLIHGLIRDEQNRKMSKSLNNGIDPIDVIDNYGVDALRLFLISSSTMGDDLRYSEEKIKFFWSFLNKIWNAKNLISPLYSHKLEPKHEINKWIITEFIKTQKKIFKYLDNFNFVLATKTLVDFSWNIFCNGFLENCKPLLNTKFEQETRQTMFQIYLEIIKLLHPFAPFTTDKINSLISQQFKWLLNSNYGSFKKHKVSVFIVKAIEIIEAIRTARISNSIKKTEIISVFTDGFEKNSNDIKEFLTLHNINLVKNLEDISQKETIKTKSLIIFWENKHTPPSSDEELLKQKTKLEFEVKRCKTILSNQNFIKKAPKEKVSLELEKLKKYEEQLESLTTLIKNSKQ